MTPDRMRRAAEVLREEAECLRRSHVMLDGAWSPDAIDQGARASHDEMLALATELETHARTLR